MIMKIYKEALAVLAKKPVRLWGISLLSGFLSFVLCLLFYFPFGVAICISLLISTGMTMVYLHGFRGEQVYAVQLFDCFKDWATIKRVLCGMAWMALWVFLWALIPIVGLVFAIIKAYAWRLVPYILVQEPDIAPTQAIKVSEQRTMGYKGKMFGADIFVFLGIFVVSLILGLLSVIPYVGVVFTVIACLFSIAVSLFAPLFLGLVQAGFYEEINAGKTTCPNCGAACGVGSGFCSSCGTKLN